MIYWTSPLIILLAFAAYGVLHSVLASSAVKEWARRRIGEDLVFRTYRLVFNLIGVVTLFPIVFLALWLPDLRLYTVPRELEYVFFLGQALGILFIVTSYGLTDVLDFLGFRQLVNIDRSPKLAIEGIYRYLRHPLYTGSMLVLWLIPSMTLNWMALILGASLYFIIGARYEERKLEEFYGKAYRDYKARTPMFIPWPRKPREG